MPKTQEKSHVPPTAPPKTGMPLETAKPCVDTTARAKRRRDRSLFILPVDKCGSVCRSERRGTRENLMVALTRHHSFLACNSWSHSQKRITAVHFSFHSAEISRIFKMKASLVPATAVAAAACIAGPAAAFAPQVRARSATALQFGRSYHEMDVKSRRGLKL